jgi:hypothetical protein
MSEGKKIPFTDVDVSKYDPQGRGMNEHETLLSFVNDGGNYAFNEWWFEEGRYLFNEWCKNHKEYKWEYCKN